MAKRYGVLPSVLLATGYSTDMICANLAVGYENYVSKCHQDGVDPKAPMPTRDEMLAMIERTRSGRQG